jgi:hypothetical protein
LSESQGKVYATTKGPIHSLQKHLEERAEIFATSRDAKSGAGGALDEGASVENNSA